ncbi:MAG TPA: alpha/beta hydrolase [Elainellaceae cyanobacterium]
MPIRQTTPDLLIRYGLIGISCLAIAYVGLGLGFRVGQTRLIFFPPGDLKSTPIDAGLFYEEVWLSVDGDRLHGWWIPANKASAPTVLFFHGNASNIGDMVNRAARFHQMGVSVLLIDYRGYGRSTDIFPNETRVYQDAEAAWIYLTETRQIAPAAIVVYGQSLGGAIALDLVSRYPDAAGVIVESTFTSIQDMVDRNLKTLFPINWILTQHFNSIEKVQSTGSKPDSGFQVPSLFIHGTGDRTVPVEMSHSLYEAAPDPKQLLLIPGATHNNVAELGGARYFQAVQTFIENHADLI